MAQQRSITADKFFLEISGDSIGWLGSRMGLQQAIKGEVISSPKDREAVAEILRGLAHSPLAQAELRHSKQRKQSDD